MILVENPMIQCDVMSYISLAQASAAMYDQSLDPKTKQKIHNKTILAGAIFCGVALAFNEKKFIVDDIEYSAILTPSIATIGESDSRDGAYVYITRNQGGFYELPKPDSRIDDVICIYASFDVETPVIEFYYGELLMCSVSIVDIPHMTMCDKDELKDEFMKQAYSIIETRVQDAIAKVQLSTMAGYKDGYNAALNELNEGE